MRLLEPGRLVAAQRLPEHVQGLDDPLHLGRERLKLDVSDDRQLLGADWWNATVATNATTYTKRRSQSDRKRACMINSSETTRDWVAMEKAAKNRFNRFGLRLQ